MPSVPPVSDRLVSGARIRVLAPHPDDESLATGGLIQQALAAGAEVRITFVTDGDNNPWPQRWMECRWRIDADCRHRWGMRRRGEAVRALEVLGVGPDRAEFLGLPDAGVMALWNRRDTTVLDRFAHTFAAWPPDLLVVPSPHDRHPDHRATFWLAQQALVRSGLMPAQFSFMIHPPWLSPQATGSLLHLTPEQRHRKLQAILCHETQTALSRGRFSAFARREEAFLPEPAPRVHPFSAK